MKICLDMDGTICEIKRPDQSYADVKPIEGAVETIKKWKESGHYIIIDTARHMVTCNGNQGQIIAKQGKTLIEWLDKYEIPYDEIWFAKPYADIYIDDKALKFTSWKEINL